jgi:hypothetical protein
LISVRIQKCEVLVCINTCWTSSLIHGTFFTTISHMDNIENIWTQWFQHENKIWSLESLQCCMAVFSHSCLRMISFNFHFVCVLWLKTVFEGEEWLPFCLNMEYPRYMAGK